MTTLFILDMSSALVNSADQYIGSASFTTLLITRAFGTNPTGDLINSGLPNNSALDLVSISPRDLEILDPRALPYSRPAVSHIGPPMGLVPVDYLAVICPSQCL